MHLRFVTLLGLLVSVPCYGETVRMTIRIYDEAGENEIESIASGELFSAKVFVQDIRETPSGVFAAYPDILFDANRLSVIQDKVFEIPPCRELEHPNPSYVQFGDIYTCGVSEGEFPVPGRLDAVGGFSQVFEETLDGDEYELLSILLRAESAGVATIAPESSSDPDDPFDENQSVQFGTLVYLENDFVCPNAGTCFGGQEFIGDSIAIRSNCGDFDFDGDVDVADRTTQIVGWTGALKVGEGSATFSSGDCDGDGDVDTADQTGLIQNWTGALELAQPLAATGLTDPSSLAMSAIPEPSSLVPILIGGLFIARCASPQRKRLRSVAQFVSAAARG